MKSQFPHGFHREIPISSWTLEHYITTRYGLPLQQCSNHIPLATKGKAILQSLGDRGIAERIDRIPRWNRLRAVQYASDWHALELWFNLAIYISFQSHLNIMKSRVNQITKAQVNQLNSENQVNEIRLNPNETQITLWNSHWNPIKSPRFLHYSGTPPHPLVPPRCCAPLAQWRHNPRPFPKAKYVRKFAPSHHFEGKN